MAVSQVNGTTFNSTSSGSSSLAIDKPSDVAANDVLIACITCDGQGPTAPSGWVEFGGGVHPSASWNNRLYYKIVDGTEGASFTWTTGTAGPSAGCINAWRGVDLADPIAGISESTGATSTEPNTGPDLVIAATEPIGRLGYVRAVRESDEAASDPAYVAADLTEATSGISRRACVGGVSSSGNTAYTIAQFTNDSNYSGAATYSGLAVTSNRTEDHNYEATYALRADNTGTAEATVPLVSSDFVADHSNNATLEAELPPVTSEFEGSSTPPEGTITASTPAVSARLTGGVPVDGTLESTLPLTDVFLFSETRPFGRHVIVVEPEKRGLLVVDQNNSADLIPIYLSEVTVGVIPAASPNMDRAAAAATAYDVSVTAENGEADAPADAVSVTATANDPSVSTASNETADAGAASVAAVASGATVSTTSDGSGAAGEVSVLAVASDATVSTSSDGSGLAGEVSVLAVASGATVSTSSDGSGNAGEVSVLAVASAPSATVKPSGGEASASATASGATVSTVASTNASAGAVSATATANGATVTSVSNITASAGAVSATATANGAVANVGPAAGAVAVAVTG